MSEVIEFYRGKNILITGAAGFLGRLLMERLLRICEVGQIFIIVRDKNGLRAEDRLDNIFNIPVFDRLRKLKPRFLNSVTLVKGDVGLPGLGLSKYVRAVLIDKIDVVFHSAATVNFDEPIRTATAINVRGTKEMALLCREMRNLKAFIHVSTAFSNCLNDEIGERFYDPPLPADELIDLCEGMEEGNLVIAAEKFMEGWPNTYVFTKCVAEDAIKTYAAGLPTCIFRPAVIICTKREPMEGWIDNYYGPSGLIATVAEGLIRVARADREANTVFVPADMCVSVMMCIGQKTGKYGFVGETKIFNFASSTHNRLTYGKFADHFLKAGRRIPSERALWYPRLTVIKSRLLYSVISFVYNILPALLVDLTMLIFLKKPKALKMTIKTLKFLDVMSYFGLNTWTFSDDNLTTLWRQLSPTDKVLFDFDMDQIDWEEMMDIKVRGVRKYLFKQDKKTIPVAQKRRFWLRVIDRTLQASLIILMSTFIVRSIFNLSTFIEFRCKGR